MKRHLCPIPLKTLLTLTALELNKYDYKYLREEPCGELMCDVIERYPRYEHSGYTRQVAWVDQSDYQIRKVEFYDRRGDLLKTLELTGYRRYHDAYWRAQRLAMVNHQTGKSTDLVYSAYRFQTGMKDKERLAAHPLRGQMPSRHVLPFLLVLLLGAGSTRAGEVDLSGSVAGEGRFFTGDPRFAGQKDGPQLSLVLNPELR